MLTNLTQWIPQEGIKIFLVLFLSFLTGLEREEHKAGAKQFSFGGVRTFPLIGLIGYAMALFSGDQFLPVTLGFAVVGGFLMLSYRNKLATSGMAGVTTEMSGLITYLMGALVHREQYWIATTLTVASMFLLELKVALESLAERFPPEEILTFTKFLLLTAVILPVLPNKNFGPFEINPFKTWLVAAAVSTVSYGSYVIQKMTKGHGGIILAAILGGVYSSTVTTVALARRSAAEKRPHLFSGSTLIASGMMYLRLIALLALFNRSLVIMLGPPFALLAAVGIGAGWLWSRIPDATDQKIERKFEPRNPLEFSAAFFFAFLFVTMLIATHLAVAHLGKTGVFSLAAVLGVADVDPFVMGMTQSAGTAAPLAVASAAILIATSSNNFAKGIYAYALADRETGIRSLGLMAGLAVSGLVPLLWLLQ